MASNHPPKVIPIVARNLYLASERCNMTPFIPVMPFSMDKAPPKDFERKNTKDMLTKLKVISQPSQAGILSLRFFQAWFTTSPPPCIPPQMIKVQPAPCQKPEISMAR